MLNILLVYLFFRATAQAVTSQHFTAEARVRAQLIHVEFTVDKATLGQLLLQVLRFSPVSIISS
jgi:hypothetical protein